jgi:hypothetical protein
VTTVDLDRAPHLVFADPLDHLAAELEWLDLVLTRAVLDLRRAADDSPVHVSDDEVDRLLADPAPEQADGQAVDTDALDARIAALRARLDARIVAARANGVALRLPALAARLRLTELERHALLVCLAPELDRKYDRLYAYLQDDIARRRPSVDLVIGLLVPGTTARWQARRHFSAHAPLCRSGLLEVVTDPYSPSGSSGLGRMLRVAPRFVAHLLGDDQPEDALAGLVRRVAAAPPAVTEPDAERVRGLRALVDHRPAGPGGALVVHLFGPDGAAAAELARAVAARAERPAVELDVPAVPAADLDRVVTATLRESWLLGTPAVLVAGDRLAAVADALGPAVDAAMGRHPGVLLVASEQPWPAAHRPRTVPVHAVEPAPADTAVRRAVWAAVTPTPGLARELASRFRLTPGRIREAAAEVARVAATGTATTAAHWYAACRHASGHGLATVAERVAPIHGWDDLVLDEPGRDSLRALRDQVRHRERVLDEWGLGRRVAGSHGLSALFAGPPGTGKTMAATVVAADLGLDLYRVDLSRVVSKYIGETEQNLARIFAEAEGANAVLMFDEADALFGKRTDVADAHDRYANIEVSYLLQRMEQYEGIAVLASNLRHNMDPAFLRRLRFVVDFPFPDAAQRLLIWQAHLRAGAPPGPDVDLPLLADRLAVAGGTIRNIVLSAAFLAAAEDGRVGMDQLLRAARREYAKSDAVWPAAAFPNPGGGGR